MRFFRLFATFFRIALMNEFAYRANFFARFIQSVMSLIMALGGLAIVYAHTDDLGGWGPMPLLALTGIYVLMGGVIRMLIEPCMSQLMEDVIDGKLDFVLTKPEDAQILISIRAFQIWKLFDILNGLMLIGIALVRMEVAFSFWAFICFFVTLASGIMIVYSFWLILSTLTFWFVRIGNILEVFNAMYAAGRWPITIYPQWLRMLLTFLVPVAFAVTVPAEALVHKLNMETLLLSIFLAVGLFVFARIFWKIGIRYYAGASA